MSLRQLTASFEGPLSWFTLKRFLLLGSSALVLILLIFYLDSNSNADAPSKTAQMEELIRANESLKETIEMLRKRSGAKQSFAKTNSSSNAFVSFEPGQGFQKPYAIKNDLYIPRGAVFRARLITSIKTSIQESFVIAETTNTFEMDSRRRIEKGSRLIGSASLDRVLQGVVVKFDTLVTKKGIQYDDLSLIALSERAYPLIEGIYFSEAGLKYGTALAFGFLSAFASGGMEREATPEGSVAKPSLTNQALSGLGVASFKVAEEAMQSLKSESVEHVVVPAGTDIYIAFARKWTLDPEKGISK